MKINRCLETKFVSGVCQSCGRTAWPAHLLDGSDGLSQIYCADCCPSCVVREPEVGLANCHQGEMP